MKKLLRIIENISLAIFNVLFFIAYFIVNLLLMPFYGFKLPKVAPYHVSDPFVGNISVKESFNDKYVQSREFPYEK